jgi:translation initiation factor IF-1
MSEPAKTWTFKVEDIFEDIPDDPENINMTIPPEICEAIDLKPGDPIKVLWGDQGTIIIEKIKEEDNEQKEQTEVEKDLMEFEGEIVDILPNQMFKVKLDDNDYEITAYTGGKMRQFKIRMVMGDKVKVEMSPYDLSKGRITYRI